MINFPSSPTPGQTFISNKVAYTFTNGGWRASRATPTALPFNYVVNPAMQISQQVGRGGTWGSGWSPADQWQMNSGAPGATTSSFEGTPNYIRLSSGSVYTTIAAGDASYFVHWMEGNRVAPFLFGTSNAKPVVLKFKARISTAPVPFTFSTAIRNALANYSYVHNFTIPTVNIWNEFTMVIPGPTSGTWPTDTALALCIFITGMSGTTLTVPLKDSWQAGNFIAGSGISNLHAAVRSFDIADVGLHLDPNSTGIAPLFETPNPGQAHLDSLRFWSRNLLRGVSAGAAVGRNGCNYITDMRIGPSYALVGAVNAWDQATSSAVTGMTPYPNIHYCEADCTTAAAMATGRSCFNNPDNPVAGGNYTIFVANSAR